MTVEKLEVDGIGYENNNEYPLPFENSDGCKGYNLTCPLQPGISYTLNGTFIVAPYFTLVLTLLISLDVSGSN